MEIDLTQLKKELEETKKQVELLRREVKWSKYCLGIVTFVISLLSISLSIAKFMG